MITSEPRMAEWLRLIRAEYAESPGMALTKPQVQRLWGLDAPTCDALLDRLVTDGYLRRTRTVGYIRADGR